MRRKTFSLGHLQPAEAAAEMELLEHDFHLFIDDRSGGDAVIYRKSDGRYAVMGSGNGSKLANANPAIVNQPGPPTLTLAEAVERLNVTGNNFVFFTDSATGRGNVAYLRYDGHYGVIAPAAD